MYAYRSLIASRGENLTYRVLTSPRRREVSASVLMKSGVLVVKIGGGEGIAWDAICDDVVEIVKQRPVVLVHGGSFETNQVATALGHPPVFLDSPSGYQSRYTDLHAMDAMKMVYAGRINKSVVERLAARRTRALGLCGLDGGLWTGPRKKAIKALANGRTRIVRDSLTGRVDRVNTDLLSSLLAAGYTPVLTPPALSDDGMAINVDGDRAAAATAIAIQANQLVILSNVPGVLKRFPDEASLLTTIARRDLETAREEYAEGRMRIKLLAAGEALDGGLRSVILGDARRDAPITTALAGQGTTIQ